MGLASSVPPLPPYHMTYIKFVALLACCHLYAVACSRCLRAVDCLLAVQYYTSFEQLTPCGATKDTAGSVRL